MSGSTVFIGDLPDRARARDIEVWALFFINAQIFSSPHLVLKFIFRTSYESMAKSSRFAYETDLASSIFALVGMPKMPSEPLMAKNSVEKEFDLKWPM